MSYLSPAGPFKEFEEVLSVVESKRAFQIFKYVIPAIISLAFFLLGGTISIVKDFYKKEERARIALLKQKESELSFLKAQLNPHFLFNTLNSIYSLVRNRSKEAPNAVLILSSLMRYMIYETDKEKVLLKSEINFLSDYIELQKLRLTNPDNVRFDVTGSFKEKEIAPLLLISFIENAFKYGTNHKGETKVEIAINIKKDHLHFKVLNQIGVEKEKNQRNSGIGLKNIINRLELVYQNDFNLDIDKSNNTFLVDLKINNI